jgi:hypothetical protein
MYCSSCGAKNLEMANFCYSCGAKMYKPQSGNSAISIQSPPQPSSPQLSPEIIKSDLPSPPPSAEPQTPNLPSTPKTPVRTSASSPVHTPISKPGYSRPSLDTEAFLTRAGWITGSTSAIGGAMIVIGWLRPWFSLSVLLHQLDVYQKADVSIFPVNALQLMIESYRGGIAAFSLENSFLLGLLLLITAGALLSVVIIGVQFVIAAFTDLQKSSWQAVFIKSNSDKVRAKSIYLFVMMALIFIPHLLDDTLKFLELGYYISFVGAIIAFIGANEGRDRIPNPRFYTDHRSRKG